jgi:hypothetical protein
VGRPPGLHALQEFGNLAQWRPDKHDFLVSKIAMPFENYLTQAIGFNRPTALIGLDAPIPPGRHTLETESIPVPASSSGGTGQIKRTLSPDFPDDHLVYALRSFDKVLRSMT